MPILNLEQNYFIWHEKRREKSKTNHRKSEEKHEFECFKSESLVFQWGYPNHALTPNNFHGLLQLSQPPCNPRSFCLYRHNDTIFQAPRPPCFNPPHSLKSSCVKSQLPYLTSPYLQKTKRAIFIHDFNFRPYC
jgi:hypothetical protein